MMRTKNLLVFLPFLLFCVTVNAQTTFSGFNNPADDTQGLLIGSLLGPGNFLQDLGDQIEYQADATITAEVAMDLPVGSLVAQRWSRTWQLTKTDVNTNGGDIALSFDFSDAGIGGTPDATFTYYLLYRAGTTGDFSVLPLKSSVIVSGDDKVAFILESTDVLDGYYTLGRSMGGEGNVLNFDGVDDYVDLGDNIDLATKSFTIEFWARRASLDNLNERGIIAQGTGATNEGLHILFRTSGAITFAFYNNDLVSPEVYTDLMWHHWACTYDEATNERKIYRDGILVAEDIATGDYQGSGTMMLGRRFSSTPRFFEGSIDEVRIWETARSDDEILNNMAVNLAGDEAGLIAYYRMNQSGDIALPDLTPNSHQGIRIGAAGTNNLPQYVTESYRLNDFGKIENAAVPTLAASSAELSLSSMDATGEFLDDLGDIMVFAHTGSSFSEVTSKLPASSLLTQRYNRMWRLFIDDVSDNDGNVELSFELGATPNSEYTFYLLGSTDTSANFSVVPVKSVLASGTRVTFTVDEAMLNHEGYYTMGRSDMGEGNALSFDGTDDHVDLGTGFNLAANSFTIEFWAKRATPDGTAKTVVSQGGATLNSGLHLQFTASGEFNFGFWNNDLTTTATYLDTDWHHYACTYNAATNERKIYRDGIEVVADVAAADYAGSGTLYLGSRFGPGTLNYAGELDEVRIWNDVRSDQEIFGSIYANIQGDEAGLLAYYRMNQTGDIVLPDVSGNEVLGARGGSTGVNNAPQYTSADYRISDVVKIVNATVDITNATSAELSISSTDAVGEFLDDEGDILIFGHDENAFSLVANSLPVNSLLFRRISRSWKLFLDDVNTNGGNLRFSFDMGATPNSGVTFYLLGRSDASSSFSVIEVEGVSVSGNVISFNLDASILTSGYYYTIGQSLETPGNALEFDGDDDHVNIGSGIDLANKSFTIEMWVQRQNVTGAEERALFSQGTLANNEGLHILFRTTGELNFGFWNDDLQTLATYTDTLWHHYAFTYDATTQTRTIYQDGIVIGSDVAAANFSGSGDVYIGSRFSAGNRNFLGRIDEVRVWEQALDMPTINANLAFNLAGNETGLLAYYRMNQVGDIIPPDLSNNTNVAARIGAAGTNNKPQYVTSGAIFSSILPVEFLGFDAKWTEDRQVLIQWSTTVEVNNDFFAVERRQGAAAGTWQTIGTVSGAGNSQSVRSYQFEDINIPAVSELNTLQYRLRQVDFDGQTDYSNVVELIQLPVSQPELSIFPNPNAGSFRTLLNLPEGEQATRVDILNTLGQSVYRKTISLSGNTELRIEEAELSTGLYILSVETSARTLVKKFLVQ